MPMPQLIKKTRLGHPDKGNPTVRIPREVAEDLGLTKGSKIDISRDGERLILTKSKEGDR